MTPRENLLKTLRCEDPEWIPVCPYLFPNENPTQGIPERLEDVFRSHDMMKLGEYWGADDFMIAVDKPADLRSDACSLNETKIGTHRKVTILSTPRGDLRQVTTFMDGLPSLVTERYVKTKDDALKLIAYFESLRVESSPEARRSIRETRERLGERGVLFCRTVGTPLGMCYRVHSDLTNLIYLIADEPATIGDLFAVMEEKYIRLIERMLREAPEIDAFFGMDDTSTTLISPAMFDRFNVDLTNARADLCHRHGKLYLHHSCGWIRDLLPIYRKTRMDGVDAFTPPPIGNVGYAEGRALLGPRCSIQSGLSGGLGSLEEAAIREHVENRFADARKAGNVVLSVGGAHLNFPAMERIFELAQKTKRG